MRDKIRFEFSYCNNILIDKEVFMRIYKVFNSMFFLLLINFFVMTELMANQVTVLDVKVISQGEHRYRFSVTLAHNDVDWTHYANRWEILDKNDHILATRTLHHPHVNEQPFTRSLNVTLPIGMNIVQIRGHDSIHQYGKAVQLILPKNK
jgi:hypothetical protein